MQTAKRVLLVTDPSPGVWGGSAQYQRLLLRALAGLGYEVHLVFETRMGEMAPEVGALAATCTGPFVPGRSILARRVRQVGAFLAGRPLILGGGYPKALEEQILRLVESLHPAWIVVSHLRMGGFVPILRERYPQARILFVDHNCETNVRELYIQHGNWMDRLAAKADLPRVRQFEGRAVAGSDGVVVLSARDADLLRRLFQPRKMAVVPPVLPEEESTAWPAREQRAAERRILWCGTMSYRAKRINVDWLATEIYPAVLARMPDAKLDIVGPYPPRRTVAAARRYPGLTVTGWVEDVLPYYRRAAVCVLPTLVGSGFELKTIEAARMGCPMVGTAIPLESAELEDGRHCLQAESADELADSLCRVMQDPGLAESLARAALERVRALYSPDGFGRRLAQFLADLDEGA